MPVAALPPAHPPHQPAAITAEAAKHPRGRSQMASPWSSIPPAPPRPCVGCSGATPARSHPSTAAATAQLVPARQLRQARGGRAQGQCGPETPRRIRDAVVVWPREGRAPRRELRPPHHLPSAQQAPLGATVHPEPAGQEVGQNPGGKEGSTATAVPTPSQHSGMVRTVQARVCGQGGPGAGSQRRARRCSGLG